MIAADPSSPRACGYGLGASIRRGTILLPIVFAIGLSACASTRGPGKTADVQIDTERPMSAEEIETASSDWGQRYAANPKDKTAALNYATALRRAGRTEQAVAVLEKTIIEYPDDRIVLASFGKALAADKQLDRALGIIRKAQTPDRPDWRLLSAEATILDQKGQNIEARKLYRQARDFAPDEPTILSNLGMSYLLTGNLGEAETALRQASSMQGADSRVRQNLALAVGLQGRFDEAEEIASAELSTEQATANVAYLKTMLNQQDSWKKLKSTEEKNAASVGES